MQTYKGGIIGFIIGIFLNAWITIGQKVWGKTYEDFKYESTTENCTNFINTTVVQNNTIEPAPDIQRLFKLVYNILLIAVFMITYKILS